MKKGSKHTEISKLKMVKIGEYTCKYCGKIFNSNIEHNGHIIGVHFRSNGNDATQFKKGNIPWNKGRFGTNKLSENRITTGMLGKHHSTKSCEKDSQSMKAKWKDPNFAKKVMEARKVTPNKQEMKLQNILYSLYPNEWMFVGDGKLVIDGKCPDFVNVNGRKLIVELYGDYWHKNDLESERVNCFKEFGYRTLIIWEHELKNQDLLKEKIKEFCNV